METGILINARKIKTTRKREWIDKLVFDIIAIIINPKKSKNIRDPVPIIHAPSIFFRMDLITIKKEATTVLIMKLKSKYSVKSLLLNVNEISTAIKIKVENQKYFVTGLLKSE